MGANARPPRSLLHCEPRPAGLRASGRAPGFLSFVVSGGRRRDPWVGHAPHRRGARARGGHRPGAGPPPPGRPSGEPAVALLRPGGFPWGPRERLSHGGPPDHNRDHSTAVRADPPAVSNARDILQSPTAFLLSCCLPSTAQRLAPTMARHRAGNNAPAPADLVLTLLTLPTPPCAAPRADITVTSP